MGGWAGGRQQREALEKRLRASVIQLLSLQPLQARQQSSEKGRALDLRAWLVQRSSNRDLRTVTKRMARPDSL